MKQLSTIKRILASGVLAFLISSLCFGQTYRPLKVATWPESDKDTAMYTVKGERHGYSFFKQHRFPEVEYEAGETLSWNKYHTMDVMYTWLGRWAKQYPDLIDLYEVAQSYEGRPILQVSLTNKKTGKDTDKPAAFFEGGRHSGEVTASESAFWLLDHLLKNYGKDEKITWLLDTKTIYIRPENNPDGSNLYLHTAMSNRSSVRPTDNDGDGLLDEDAPDDLDGDGVIYTMRWVDPKNGRYITDPRDPSGMLMKRAPQGQGVYATASEGIDNDQDGDRNEDGIGGLDLHRNYPENWRPDRGQDATGRGQTQGGAGEFPLSEPETRAVFTFLMTHPNVSVINSMDTRVPMHLRGPSTEFSAKAMYEKDRALLEYFDTLGMKITGYPWAGDTYNTYNTRTAISSWSGDSTKPSPLFGHGPDFGYSYYGAVWYGDEIWNGGKYKDMDGDGEMDELDIYLWDQQENGGKGFKKWTLFNHPELGPVEIGGAHPKFFSQNPPPDHLEPWIRKQALFNLAMALELPTVQWENLTIKKLKNAADYPTERNGGQIYRIDVSWKNSGRIPTALDMAQRVKIVTKDLVTLEFDRKLTGGTEPIIEILQPSTQSKTREMDHLWKDEIGMTSFIVRVFSDKPVEGKIKFSSTRGGVLEKDLKLGSD